MRDHAPRRRRRGCARLETLLGRVRARRLRARHHAGLRIRRGAWRWAWATPRARPPSASSSRARARWWRCAPTSRRRSRASSPRAFATSTGPVRLCYEGTVVRLDRAAHGQRELSQAGVELAGLPGPDGDAEVIALAVEALAAVGLPRPTIDLGHLGLAREVLARAGAAGAGAGRGAALHRQARRRRAGRRCCARRAGARPAIEFARAAARAVGLARRAGRRRRSRRPPPGVQARARRARAPSSRAVEARGVDARLHVDLGEVRGFDYYTGVRFQAFVDGAPDAVLRGGRYDDLLARYGRPEPGGRLRGRRRGGRRRASSQAGWRRARRPGPPSDEDKQIEWQS